MRSAPLLVLALLTATPSLAELDSFGLGTGRDGPLNVTTTGRVINYTTPVRSDAPAGASVLRVDLVGSIKAQSLVLVHQSAGFSSTTASGGASPVTPGVVGRWELARVSSVTAPGTVRLTAPLAYSYSVPGAQVVAVPEYTDVNVSATGSIVAPPWDGNSGGIVAFLSTSKLVNDGVISADGMGFQGGVFANHSALTGCTALDLSAAAGGAAKGEGVAVFRFGSGGGRGNLVNGGGGGNCHNAGGGGGGHGNVGGTGGRTASDTDSSRAAGGLGGSHMKYSLIDQALFGGGGGAGEGNDGVGTSGGAGGGFVLVRAASVTGAGKFTANGASVSPTTGGDGAGGGGAGGAVIVRSGSQMACGEVQALGGSGGRVTDTVRQLGPGGGGSGGYALVQGSPLGTCPITVTGGAAGTTDFDGTVHGAGAGGVGASQQLIVAYQAPAKPTISAPANGAVGVASRPKFAGSTDPGLRVIVYVDGVELVQYGAGADGQFVGSYPSLKDPLSVGDHTVTVVAESFGAYSPPSSTTFSVAATLEDGGVLVPPILVVPEDGETLGPTPLFAGVAPNGLTVGIEVDGQPETITIPVDAFGRFRYQVPAETPLPPGPHFVTVHSHTETGESGPFSQATRFEVVAVAPDSGTGTVDAGTGTLDAGTGETDAGTDAGTNTPDAGVFDDVPVMVVPAEGEVVDSTPLFAGAAAPGASVSIEVDSEVVATVVSDATGAFRYPVPEAQALSVGTHSVSALVAGSVTGASETRSKATGFEVRGPSNLDVGCGCGASPTGVLGGWALLWGLAAAARRRRQ
ncbi:hypothetical protein JY651_37855 [Pyxidicoccus parkwayensis]|uniref:Uncharacterized protein n=1 Tax=Pyxidicoccus parkwayensis TaxID=2813578 RepID=A0ABX7NU86_9BACT|nr:MYXO-CTERM sorting domain-containing protein [Pyxidicoccus parkwaysis]QSQ20944.1 hypothetical protein JY651_37855 [Pyxidicoccus parkwaysis]